MASKEYVEKLKDVRWQKKRLEILQLDRWQCRHCESKTATMHVHHLYYEVGREPWEYPNDVLITLCQECHMSVKTVEWKKALLDLNMTEYDLLELALQLKFRKQKHTELMADINAKHKMRDPWPHMWYNLLESREESEEYDVFKNQHKLTYVHG